MTLTQKLRLNLYQALTSKLKLNPYAKALIWHDNEIDVGSPPQTSHMTLELKFALHPKAPTPLDVRSKMASRKS